MAKIEVKWARLQSGWQRTEKQKGVYDFEWLDKIVDRFLSLDIQPWLCLCYGNELYTEEAKKYFGAVTHVLISDPTRGYGIFIENMLASAE